jgi:predicted enzyme related to lactoylglutathione lyase
MAHVVSSALITRSVSKENEPMKRTRFERAEPILNVADLARSVRYYVDVLGFANADWAGDDFTHVSRDDAGIYLSEGDQGNPGTWVWIGVEDVASLYREYTESGASILHAPTNYPWAYEMKVLDPDGHILRFGSEPRNDILFAS